MQKFLIGSVALSGLLAGGAMAAEKIVVVTSFPEDMTSVAAFLLSDDSAYVTGQTISVNGGLWHR